MASSLPNLIKDDLRKPVQAVLQRESAEPSEWQIEALAGGFGNAVSLGVYLVTGIADDNGQQFNWKLVLKMICLPDDAAWQATSTHPNQFNYWRREANLLESGLLEQIPDLFVIPQCYGVTPKPDNIVWLWLEHFDNADDGLWNLDRHARIAELSGQFAGYFLQQEKLPDYEWLNRDFFRQWSQSLSSSVAYWHDAEQQAAFWNNPHIQELLGSLENNALYQFMQLENQILNKLDEMPKTICHGDFYRSNLMAQTTNDIEKIIVIDWAYIGLGAIGEDLGSLAYSATGEVLSIPIANADKQLFDSYIEGLHKMGWDGDIQQVRFGYVSSLVLRISYFWLFIIHFSETPIRNFGEFESRLNEEFLTQHRLFADTITHYARQSLNLLNQV